MSGTIYPVNLIPKPKIENCNGDMHGYYGYSPDTDREPLLTLEDNLGLLLMDNEGEMDERQKAHRRIISRLPATEDSCEKWRNRWTRRGSYDRPRASVGAVLKQNRMTALYSILGVHPGEHARNEQRERRMRVVQAKGARTKADRRRRGAAITLLDKSVQVR